MKQIRTNAKTANGITERETAHRKLARQAAGESIVLLKNDALKGEAASTLPLAPCSIALFGAGAAATIKGGTGSGEVNERYSVTIEQGLKNAGFKITTDAWLREYEKLMKAEKEKANKSMAKGMLSPDPDVRINFMANSFQYPSGRLINDSDIK